MKAICTLKNLKQGKNYYFKIRGISKNTNGKWSKAVKIKVNNINKKRIRYINKRCDLKIPLDTKILRCRDIDINSDRFKIICTKMKMKKFEKVFRKLKTDESAYTLFDDYAKNIK